MASGLLLALICGLCHYIASSSSSSSTALTMSSYEVVYFDFTGRAEPIRILLHIAGIDFKDTRFKGADWPTIKPTTPLGQVPLLKIDETAYCQSVALTRYAAKLAGWYPQDPLEALKCDEIADSINEILSKVPKKVEDEEEFKKLRQEFQESVMTKFASLVEGRIQANGGLYVTGTEPTFGDLFLSQQVKTIESGLFDHIDKNFYDQYPGIVATVKAMGENEKIKAYMESVKKE